MPSAQIITVNIILPRIGGESYWYKCERIIERKLSKNASQIKSKENRQELNIITKEGKNNKTVARELEIAANNSP